VKASEKFGAVRTTVSQACIMEFQIVMKHRVKEKEKKMEDGKNSQKLTALTVKTLKL